MINSFFGINTTLNGLLTQQAEQNVLADNIAKTGSYVDANGYVMTTEQQLNVTQGAPYILNSSNGNLAIGTGPLLQSITRMRDSFLDKQIQQQSQIVGKEQVLSNTLSQIQNILNGSATTTLGYAITQMGSAFSSLAAASGTLNTDVAAGAPAATITADQANVAAAQQAAVNAGVAFAAMANGQYSQLKNLQTDMNDQIQQDVTSVNSLLQQINQVNQALLNSPGSNQNDLLDARDYDITLLSRLMNVSASYSANGTANVYLGGLALVNSAGAAILSTNVENGHNPGLTDITVQSPQGTFTFSDASSTITSGKLGGDLQARDTVIESYLEQVDQISFSVSQLANLIYSSGYDPTNSATAASGTGINFFVGGAVQSPNTSNIAQTTNPANTAIVNNPAVNQPQLGASAADISVNAALIQNSGHLAYSSAYGAFVNNEIAQAMSQLPNLLTNSFVASNKKIGTNVDPGVTLSTDGATVAMIGTGSISINSNAPVNYDPAVDTIYSVLAGINANNNNVTALYNYNAQQVLIFSTAPINLNDSNNTDGFTIGTQLTEILTSSIRMNNGFAPTDPQIDAATPMDSVPAKLGIPVPVPIPYTAGNQAAFRVTPSTTGTFAINGIPIYTQYPPPPTPNNSPYSFTNISQALSPTSANTLSGIINEIDAAGAAYFPLPLAASFNKQTQQFSLAYGAGSNVLTPIQVTDISGNFSVFTGLNATVSASTLASNLTSQVTAGAQNANTLFTQSNDSLTQLNNEQANIGTLSAASGSGTPTAGTPVSLVEEQAMQALVAYNASLEMLQIQNQMFADLLNVVAPVPPSGATPFVL